MRISLYRHPAIMQVNKRINYNLGSRVYFDTTEFGCVYFVSDFKNNNTAQLLYCGHLNDCNAIEDWP